MKGTIHDQTSNQNIMRGLTGYICWRSLVGHSVDIRTPVSVLKQNNSKYLCRLCGEPCDIDDQGSNLKLIAGTVAVLVAIAVSVFFLV